jgi:hypothetical protein
MSELRDEDGNLLIRTPDGDLVPVIEPEPDALPNYPPLQPCAEHTTFGYIAASCPDCISEIKGGDRPKRYLGRVLPEMDGTE